METILITILTIIVITGFLDTIVTNKKSLNILKYHIAAIKKADMNFVKYMQDRDETIDRRLANLENEVFDNEETDS